MTVDFDSNYEGMYPSSGLDSPPTSEPKGGRDVNKQLAVLFSRLDASTFSTDSESNLSGGADIRASLSPKSNFEFDLNESAERQIIDATGSMASESELEEIVDFIDTKGSKYASKDVYLPRSRKKLPRTLEFYKDGSIYIHFNKTREDVRVGKGKSKTAKFTLNYGEKKLCVRTTELGHCSKEIDFFKKVEDIPGAARLLHSRVFISKKMNESDQCLVKTEMIMPYYPNGTLVDIDGRLNGTEFSTKEKCAIKTRIAEKVREAISEFHKRGLYHGDLHEGNIFLDKDFEPIIADFGRSGTHASDSEKRNDNLCLDRIFSSMLEDSDSLLPTINSSSNT